MVATADSTDENWPATMEYRGVAYKKGSGQDSCDVVYVEDYGKFLAFSTYNRFTESSGIAVMESNDGITFEQVAVFVPASHNTVIIWEFQKDRTDIFRWTTKFPYWLRIFLRRAGIRLLGKMGHEISGDRIVGI